MRLFATMCNQPQRLLEALGPVRAALVAAPPIARWGLGYVQSGEVLLARTPRPSATEIDLYAALEGVKSDCVLAHAVRDPDSGRAVRLDGGTDETPPFRYRRWMTVWDAPFDAPEPAIAALAGQIPDYLRRNIRGRGTPELALHVLLALLQDVGAMDEPNVPVTVLRRTLSAALGRILEEVGAADVGNCAVSNGRSMLLARPAGGSPPMWLRRLHVAGDRGGRDETFRGVLFVSAGLADAAGERELPPAAGDGFEEIPAGSIVTVSRDLRVDVAPI